MGLFSKREAIGENRAGTALEVRDPKAATQSLRYISPGSPTPPDWNATTAFQMAYYMNIVVYACVRLAANTIASLPFRTGADPAKPNDYDPNSPLARLLGPPPGGPAPKLSARRLWAWTVAQRIVTGRNGWEIERSANTVAALWPLASSALIPVKSEGGVEWFKGFEYGRIGSSYTNDVKKLAVEQVVYDWSPSGTDFREPESDLQAANLDIAVAIMQSRYDFAFLKNDARPAAIIVTEEFEDQDSFEAFKRQWGAAHQGVDNAGRAAFLEATGSGENGVKGAVDVTVLGISPKDAQAAQRHSAAMERTAIALGTPWGLLDASGRTFDNAGQEWKNYVLHRILPMCADFQDMVNMQLAPLLGDQIGWFETSSLGIKDMDRLDAAGVATLYSAGVITKDEGRQPFGLPAVDGGDAFNEPMPAPLQITPLKVAASEEPGEVRKMHEFVAGPDGMCAVCGKPMMNNAHGVYVPAGMMPKAVVPRAAEEETREPDRALAAQARRSKLWNTTQGHVKVLERQWERAFAKLFARQGRSVVARLEGKRGRSLVGRDVRAAADEVFDPAHWLAETIDDVTALYEAVVAAGGMRVAEMFGLAFDLEAPYAQDFIQARANQLAGQVTDTTYQAVKDALAKGVGEGESIPDLATRLRGVFEQASQTRARTIARTETISGFNGSASLTAAQYGADVVAGQEWIATQDDRTRETHSDMDGEVIGMGEEFSNGLSYPGDPNGDEGETINCRCTVAFLTPEEMGGRAPRMIERRVAISVLSMVRAGAEDVEPGIRAALRLAA